MKFKFNKHITGLSDVVYHFIYVAWHLKGCDKPPSLQYLHKGKKKKFPQLPLLSQAPGILELEKCSFSLKALFTVKGKCPKVARRRGTPASARQFC